MDKAVPKELTPKQEAFVLAYLETGNASEAYRRSYKADGMLPQTINRSAKELLDNPKIAARLAVINRKAEAKALLSLEEHMDELKALRELAKQNAQLSAAIAAEVKRGELRKFYVKQIETGGPGEFEGMTADELRNHVRREAEELGLSDEKAKASRRSREAGKQLN